MMHMKQLNVQQTLKATGSESFATRRAAQTSRIPKYITNMNFLFMAFSGKTTGNQLQRIFLILYSNNFFTYF
jgi:hypothetical protein